MSMSNVANAMMGPAAPLLMNPTMMAGFQNPMMFSVPTANPLADSFQQLPGVSSGRMLLKGVAALAVAILGFVLVGRFTNLNKCRAGYKPVAGVCWQQCPENSKSVGALCREKCRTGYKDTAAVCWFDKCPQGQKRAGTRCYETCRANEKEVGCCLCRERCRSGYREVLGVCWRGLRSYVPKTRPRKSDGKLLSYVPKTFARKSYVNGLGLVGAVVFPVILLLILGTAARV
jgi:hypothetical protein